MAPYDPCCSLSGHILSATRELGTFREESPILLSQDVATTIGGPAMTREVCIFFRIIRIAVIERQFFPFADISEGDQPERASRLGDVTVGITGVVAVASRIPEHRAINII